LRTPPPRRERPGPATPTQAGGRPAKKVPGVQLGPLRLQLGVARVQLGPLRVQGDL